MSVSINTSLTAPIRLALQSNLKEATRSGIALATGNAITHAYEDPTGLAIGSSLKSAAEILSVVATGIEQSQSMLYIAEEGLKEVASIVNNIEIILAKGKLGHMTDKLVKETLQEAYIQMQQELNRVASANEFNGQKLLNGTGGNVTTGKAATINQALTKYDMTNAVSALGTLSANTDILSGLTANTVNQSSVRTSGTLTVKTASEIAPEVSGGTLTKSGSDFILSNATLTIKGVSVADTASPANIATADITITGVTLKFANATFSNDVLSGTPTVSEIKTENISFTNVTDGMKSIRITNSSAITDITMPTGEISDIDTEYTSTGGRGTISTYRFVTGTNLANDVIKVQMPNLSLVDTAAAPSIISTLNVAGLTSDTMPKGLTQLESIADVEKDIPLIAALKEEILRCMNRVGAYQKRFLYLREGLETSREQLDNAASIILDSDLSKESEKGVRAKVNLNLAISRLSESNHMLESLQKIVTG